MKKMASLVMSFLFLFAIAAHADNGRVSQAISDYKMNLQTRNIDAKASMDKLALNLLNSGATKEDLISYVKENSSRAEFKNFLAMVNAGSMELEGLTHISQNDFRIIMATALNASSSRAGAKYSDRGVAAIVAGAALGLMAFETNRGGRAQELGIAAGVSGAVDFAIWASLAKAYE